MCHKVNKKIVLEIPTIMLKFNYNTVNLQIIEMFDENFKYIPAFNFIIIYNFINHNKDYKLIKMLYVLIL